MVYANDTTFCAAVTTVPAVVKMVCITQTMLSNPETMVSANEKIFLTAETIFPLNRKMVSGVETLVFVVPTPLHRNSRTATMSLHRGA